MSEKPSRIHVTGGPGSGKTRVAKQLAAARGVPYHDLDGLLLAIGEAVEKINADGGVTRWAADAEWVSEGVYVTWSRPFLEAADVILWLDPPWRVASYRILSRQVRAELARQNRFPGWRRLYRFWRWAARFYDDRNPQTVNRYGAPNTRSMLEAGLAPYWGRVTVCRTNEEVDSFVRGLLEARRWG